MHLSPKVGRPDTMDGTSHNLEHEHPPQWMGSGNTGMATHIPFKWAWPELTHPTTLSMGVAKVGPSHTPLIFALQSCWLADSHDVHSCGHTRSLNPGFVRV